MTTSFNPPRYADDESSTTSPTVAAEDTPLLRSESSSVTARDVSPPSERQPGSAPEQSLGWKRTTAIVLSMWALIFLQGELFLCCRCIFSIRLRH